MLQGFRRSRVAEGPAHSTEGESPRCVGVTLKRAILCHISSGWEGAEPQLRGAHLAAVMLDEVEHEASVHD